MAMNDEPTATVREIDGQLVSDDPVAAAVMTVIAKRNCRATFEAQRDRVDHFVARMRVLGKGPSEAVIVLLNVNTVLGARLAEILMPNQDAVWQTMRDQGAIPFARGLADRGGLEKLVEGLDTEAGEKLRVELAGRVAVIVMDHDVVEVFGVT